jgi:hypothetical protein
VIDSPRAIPTVVIDQTAPHMGLRLTYHPERNALEIESRPACTTERVGEPTPSISDWRRRPWAMPVEQSWSDTRSL